MTVAFQRMFGILERWNNNQGTPSLSKPHELSYRSSSNNGTKIQLDRIIFAAIIMYCNNDSSCLYSMNIFVEKNHRSSFVDNQHLLEPKNSIVLLENAFGELNFF